LGYFNACYARRLRCTASIGLRRTPFPARRSLWSGVAGRWIANDINGLNGGPFKYRASAIHYAELETALAPGAVQLVDGPLELRFGTPPQDKARKASV
jgi:hypothetical protein